MRLFPCTVTMPDGTRHSVAKVEADTEKTTIYGWADGTGVLLVEAQAVLRRTTRLRRFELDTALGVVQIEHNCGTCTGQLSHPLRTWTPDGSVGPDRVHVVRS